MGMSRAPSARKIVRDPEALEATLAAHRAAGRSVVLTNGTFDLLHVGHVRALEGARGQGDVLVVGVNTDRSVRNYKGPGRPIVPEDERAELLACLACVDVVTFFDEPTAEALIRRVAPDGWAKGRDYSEETLPEAHVVRELGGSIAIVGDPKDHAASDFIDRIRGSGG